MRRRPKTTFTRPDARATRDARKSATSTTQRMPAVRGLPAFAVFLFLTRSDASSESVAPSQVILGQGSRTSGVACFSLSSGLAAAGNCSTVAR